MISSISQVLWMLVNPIGLTIILIGCSLLLSLMGWRRPSFFTGLAALLVLAISSWTTAGAIVLSKLEDRFHRPATIPERVDGIIVLGGAFEARISGVRGGYEMNEGADRMVEAAGLGLAYPDARIVVSGGSSDKIGNLPGDADLAPLFFRRMGVDPARLVLEGQSTNTIENVTESMRHAQPKPGEVWLLVTSAFHMPRSIGLFRKANWKVVAWPVDYRATGTEGLRLCSDDARRCLRQTSAALREWTALVAYWTMGRIDEPFPAP